MPRVKIYTRTWCGYCTAALGLLDAKQIAYDQIDTSDDPATRAWLVTETGQRTVPQIFIDGRNIGGCDDLYALDREGQLDAMLAGEKASS